MQLYTFKVAESEIKISLSRMDFDITSKNWKNLWMSPKSYRILIWACDIWFNIDLLSPNPKSNFRLNLKKLEKQ